MKLNHMKNMKKIQLNILWTSHTNEKVFRLTKIDSDKVAIIGIQAMGEPLITKPNIK